MIKTLAIAALMGLVLWAMIIITVYLGIGASS